MTHVYELDGEQMQNLRQAHCYLQQMLELPDYYGKNADALFDCLTEISQETLLWLNASDRIHPNLLHVFEEAAEQNHFLTLIEE